MALGTLTIELGDWSTGDGPLYQHLATALRDAIGRGAFGTGSKLPSERDLARSLDISRTTTSAAYRLLRRQGILAGERGGGTRLVSTSRWAGPPVPGAAMTSTKLLSEPLAGGIDMSASNIAGLPELSGARLSVAADEIRQLAAGTGYEPLGLPALRDAVARHYTERGLPTTCDEVLITSGAQQAIGLLFTLFGRDHGTIATENPTYAGAIDAARVVGASIIGLPMDEQGIKIRALQETIDRSAVRLVYLMTTCQNPTGAVMSTARRHDIARLAEATGTLIVDDMSLADLVLDGSSHPFLAATDSSTIITIGTLSKLFWPGLRAGWIRAPAHLMARLARLKAITDLVSRI